MVLGYLLVNYTSLADRKLTKQANAIVFKIFLPCMLFYNVYQSDIGAEITAGLSCVSGRQADF